MSFKEKAKLHSQVVNIMDALMENKTLKVMANSYTSMPLILSWGEIHMTKDGMEVYSLKSESPLESNTINFNMDKIFTTIFNSNCPEMYVFFDTDGYLGRIRIYFNFFINHPVAFTEMKSLIYAFSLYKRKRCNKVITIYRNENTPMESCRNIVIDIYGPRNHMYLVSYLADKPRLIGERFKCIGRYAGDVDILHKAICNNIIVNSGFLCKTYEGAIREYGNEV